MIALVFIILMLLCVFSLLAAIACCQQAGRANKAFDDYFSNTIKKN